MRRLVKGTTTQRSELAAEHLTERLRARGLEQLRDEDEVWALVDPSELRKPYAREMPALMRVRKLGGEKGTVPGYRTLTVLGVGRGGRRGILYHRLFSSTEPGFTSEPDEIRAALGTVGAALAGKTVTYLLDSQFDDVAVWSTIWQQDQHLVCRLQHPERLIEVPDGAGGWRPGTIAAAQAQARELARVRTELVVRKRGQRYTKRQPVTVRIAACPVRVTYPVDVRCRRTSEKQVREAWLVVVRADDVDWEPWLLLTDWPVADPASAVRVFRMYRTRWAVEDCFKFTKDVLGWEDVRLLDLAAIRTPGGARLGRGGLPLRTRGDAGLARGAPAHPPRRRRAPGQPPARQARARAGPAPPARPPGHGSAPDRRGPAARQFAAPARRPARSPRLGVSYVRMSAGLP